MKTMAMQRYPIITLLLMLFAAITAMAAQAPAPSPAGPPAPPPLPGGATLLIPESALSAYDMLEVSRHFASVSAMTEPEDRPFLRVTTSALPPQWWDVQLRWVATAPIHKGDTVLLSLRMRTASAETKTGEAMCNVCVQRTESPWDSALTADLDVGRQWQRIDLPFEARGDFVSGTYQIALNLGFGVGSVDIMDVLLLNYGQKRKVADLPRLHQTYPGREADAAWRTEAQTRIAELRMADLTVEVTDATGKAVPGATVRAEMKRHAFPFGTAVVATRLDPQEGSSDARRYREMVPTLFNSATFEKDVNWVEWENARGRMGDHKARLWRCLEWIQAHGLQVRGHTMIWPGWSAGNKPLLPEELRPMVEARDIEKLRERVRGRILEMGNEFPGQFVDWDVVNEPTANHVLQDVLGPQSLTEWFSWARRADPKAKLYINDLCILSGAALDEQRLDRFTQILKDLQASGAPVDGIGEEGHFGFALMAPQHMLDLLDRFASFGWPIQITEFDQSTDDEQLQADYLRDFYTAAFSHPGISGITMSGFWEGEHATRKTSLLRKKWSMKPNCEAYIDLTRKRWWTDEHGITGEQGTFKARGFLGDYEISVTTPDGKMQAVTAKLSKPAAPIVVKMK